MMIVAENMSTASPVQNKRRRESNMPWWVSAPLDLEYARLRLSTTLKRDVPNYEYAVQMNPCPSEIPSLAESADSLSTGPRNGCRERKRG